MPPNSKNLWLNAQVRLARTAVIHAYGGDRAYALYTGRVVTSNRDLTTIYEAFKGMLSAKT